MNGASAPPPPFDSKAAEDLFGFLPPQAASDLKNILQATQRDHANALGRLGNLASMTAQQANLQNQAAYQNQGVYNAAQGNWGSVMQGAAQQCMPNFGQQFNIGQTPPPVSHGVLFGTDQQAQDHALMTMNPLARDRYEAVAKLLDIKIRCVNRLDMVATTEWVIQKQIKDGRQVKFTWSVDDPGGGSFQHWKHMFATLIDRCAELEGNDVPDANNTADTESAGV